MICIFVIISNSDFEDYMMCAKWIPEGNYSLATLNNAISNIMNTGYLSATVTLIPNKFISTPSISNNKILIGNNGNSFEY